MRARLATPEDAGAIARIYDEAVEERTATFETRQVSETEVRGWFDRAHPIVVVEEDAGGVIAFAATAAYRAAECYSGVSDLRVVTARARRRQGAGKLALREVAVHARAAGSWKLVCQVLVGNAACCALLRSLGYREVGTYFRHGKLEGAWRDVLIVEKFLAPLGGEARPGPPSRPSRERLIEVLQAEQTDGHGAAVDAAMRLLEEQRTPDREMVEAALDAFFAARAHDPESRSRFVRLFRAYAALSPDAARHLADGTFARLGRMSVALDMLAFYEVLYVVKQTLGSLGGALAGRLPDLIEWIKLATELPHESRGRISPANVTNLLIPLALAACETEAQKREIAELAAGAKARHRVEPPSSIRAPALGVDRIPLQIRTLALALRELGASASAPALGAAKKTLVELVGAEADAERIAEAARAHEWDDEMIRRLLDLLEETPTTESGRAVAHALLAALVRPGARTSAQTRLRKIVAPTKPRAKSSSRRARPKA